MAGTSRSQIAIYAVIAAVLLLVGANSLRGNSGDAGPGFAADEPSSGAGLDSGETGEGGFMSNSATEKLVVDVSGGVVRPGVYQLKQGSRVIDAIERAGGTVAKAVPGAINRAAKLADGQQVVVPLAASVAGAAAAASTGGLPDTPISLGSATPEELEEIEGIGPVTAGKIIEFRDSHGVGSIDDLDQVSGIGPVTMEALRSGLQP